MQDSGPRGPGLDTPELEHLNADQEVAGSMLWIKQCAKLINTLHIGKLIFALTRTYALRSVSMLSPWSIHSAWGRCPRIGRWAAGCRSRRPAPPRTLSWGLCGGDAGPQEASLQLWLHRCWEDRFPSPPAHPYQESGCSIDPIKKNIHVWQCIHFVNTYPKWYTNSA